MATNKWANGEMQRKYAAGLCPWCKEDVPAVKGQRCAQHYEAHRVRQNKRAKDLLAAGLCVCCGKHSLKTKRHCERCSRRHNARVKAKRDAARASAVPAHSIDLEASVIALRISEATALSTLVAVERVIQKRFADSPVAARALLIAVEKKANLLVERFG